jgi:hypothetical protein
MRGKMTRATDIVLKILQTLYTIMTEVQLLQRFEWFKIFKFSYAVRLQRKDFETFQTVEVLRAIISIDVTVVSTSPTSSFEILFLPNQSSSRLTRASRFSICLVRYVSDSDGAHDESNKAHPEFVAS